MPVRTPRWLRFHALHNRLQLVLLLGGFLLSTFLAGFVWQKQQDSWLQRFEVGAERREHVIREALEQRLDSLRDIGRFVSASEPGPSPEAFKHFATSKLDVFHSVYWTVPHPAGSHDGQPYHDMTPGCIPSTTRWHYPIVHIVGRVPTDHLLGLDLRCDDQRLVAMLQAQDSGRVRASSQVQSVLLKTRIIALFQPVYRRDVPVETAAQRELALRGFVAVSLAAREMLAPLLQDLPDAVDYSVSLDSLRDTLTPGLMQVNQQNAHAGEVMRRVRLDFAGHPMQLTIRPSETFWASRHTLSAPALWLAGMAFTALLMAWMHSQNRRREQAELLAITRNDDLIDREARLSALIQHAPIAIMRCSQDGRILDANPAAYALFKRDDGLVGKIFLSLFTTWSAQSFRERWQQPSWLELEALGGESEHLPVLVRALSMRQANGEPYAWTMIEDLRAVRHNERLKREFVATVSHELRTPLTAIRGAVEMVASGLLDDHPDDRRAMMNMASENAQVLTGLINDLLDIERLELGKLSLRLSTQSLRESLEAAMSLARPQMLTRQLHWDVQPMPDNLFVEVDPDRLIQVLRNLFSNAIKFSPVGGQLHLRWYCDGERVSLTLRDDGPGIPPEFLPRLFQRFAQADASDTRERGGTGLGLAISRGLMERMDGTLTATSPAGSGAQFTLTLPCRHPATQEAPAQESQHVSATRLAG